MKKYSSIVVVAILIVATAATLFIGCKKEKDEAQSQPEKTETQALMDKIKVFQTIREYVNSGIKTEGVMTIEEMRQYLDLMSNYEHSEHMTCCVNTVLDTLFLAMPLVNADGNVTNTDVVETYETFETELQKCMESISDGRNIPSYFSIIMPQKIEKAEEKITVVFVRGVESNDAKGNRNTMDDDEPFIENVDNWTWGENLGLCKGNPLNATSDAAQRLSEQFYFEVPEEHQGELYYVFDVNHTNYRPCLLELPTVSSEHRVDTLMEDCADTWLFYQTSLNPEEPCIRWFEMNCFWRSINRNIVDLNAPLHYHDYNNMTLPYHTCSIIDYKFLENGYIHYVHYAHVIYCNILWIGPSPD